MFDGSDYPKSLKEQLFDNWLETGRLQKIPYNYLLVVWDDWDQKYFPAYVENRSEINSFEAYGQATGREALIAVYDLFSGSRITLE